MTVIAAALETDGTVVMAADSCSSTDNGTVFIDSHKIARVCSGGALFGLAGHTGLAQVLERRFVDHPAPDSGDLNGWAHDVAVEMTRLVRAELFDSDNEWNGAGLLGVRGGLWHIHTMLALPLGRFGAIGSGADPARGVLHVTRDMEMPAVARVRAAVEAGIAFDDGCRPPIQIEQI